MDENQHAQLHLNEQLQQLAAARELLSTTKRNLQLVDLDIELLQKERPGVVLADDVSSEHRVSWLGAQDDNDQQNGILIAQDGVLTTVGWQNPKRGMIRNQVDAAFVVTNILVAQNRDIGPTGFTPEGDDVGAFAEGFDGYGIGVSGNAGTSLAVRLTDANTGRSLITGVTEAPLDRDRGAISFSYLSSNRFGLGPNQKQGLFAEFTLPRAAAVRVEIFNLAVANTINVDIRAFVTLLGYKVYGG